MTNKSKEMGKKKVIILAILVLALIVGTVTAIAMTKDKGDNKKPVITAEEEKETQRLEDEMKDKLKDAKTEEEKEAITKEYSEKIEKASHGKVDVKVDSDGNVSVTKPSTNASGSSNASSKPSGSSNSSSSKPAESKPSKPSKPAESKPSGGTTPSKPSKPAEPEKKKVWVVDKPAWTETVKKPVYAYRDTWWIKYYDDNSNYIYTKTYYNKAEWNYDCEYAPGAGAWGNGPKEEYISHYETSYIKHPEEGHWEYR